MTTGKKRGLWWRSSPPNDFRVRIKVRVRVGVKVRANVLVYLVRVSVMVKISKLCGELLHQRHPSVCLSVSVCHLSRNPLPRRNIFQ